MKPSDSMSVKLPYFNRIYKEFHRAVQYKIRSLSKTGMMQEINSYTIFEGKTTKMLQSDQTISESEISESSAEVNASWSDLNNINRAYVENKIEEIASQFNKEMVRNFLETMNRVTESTGNVVDVSDGPLTNEKLLELRRMMPAFSNPYEDGHLMMVVSPAVLERIKLLEGEMKDSPELQRQFEQMQVQKYEEYRSRQLDRELVG